MSTPATADDLITLVRKSGLFDEGKVTAFLQAHQKDGLLQADARKVAATMVRDGVLTLFQAEQFLLGKWKGFTLGKFKLLERIGVGGMGQVFLCEHMFMRKRMAVKVLPPTKAEDPVALGRFYREARLASDLEHPNIVRTHDIDQDGPLHFLVMEYVDGTTLLDIVGKFGPLNSVRAAAYIRMAAAGLQFAHAQGMIHRDIKPGNIILDRGGVAKILDMGLARFSQEEKDQITVKYDDKNVLGSADYVAPEQTRDSRHIDIRADIYGMGATFYFVLTGHPPFPDGSIAEKIIAHQTRKPKPIREIRPDVPQGLTKIIDKMMAKDPNDRFQTPQHVVDALEVWTQSPIDPPSAAEMPTLSPAATDHPHSGIPVQTSAGATRDAGTVRPEELSRSRLGFGSSSRLIEASEAAFESAATVPVSPHRPFALPAAAGNSVVDLVLPPAPRAVPPVARLAPPLSVSELRSTANPVRPEITDTPRPPVRELPRSSAGPLPELPKLPPELSRLSPSRVPGMTPRVKPPEAPNPPVARPASLETPKPAAGEMEVARPTPPPSHEPPRMFPSLREALRGSAVPDMKKPPSMELVRVTPPEPLKATAFDVPLSPSRNALHGKMPDTKKSGVWVGTGPMPAPPEPPRRSAPVEVPARPPVYRPPTLMPFFDQPVMPSQQSLAARFLRWVLMILISTVIGALLGVAIWYQFMRK